MPHFVFALWLVPGVFSLLVLAVGMISGLHGDKASIVAWTSKSLLPLLGVLLSGYFIPTSNPWPTDKARRAMATIVMGLLCVAYYSIIALHFVELLENGRPIPDTASIFEPWLLGIQVVACAAFAPYFGLKRKVQE